MKKTIFLLFIIIVMAILVSACSSAQQSESISMTKMNKSEDAVRNSTVEISDSDEIDALKTAIRKANRLPGIVDVAAPDFTFEIGEDSYYLWIQEDAGSIMNTNDTHTLYTLQKQNAKEVYELLNRYDSFGE